MNAIGKYSQIQGVSMGSLQTYLPSSIQVLRCFVFQAQPSSLLPAELIPGVKPVLLKK